MSAQTMLDLSGAAISQVGVALAGDEDAALVIAHEYGRMEIDSTFEVVRGGGVYNEQLGRKLWRFFVRSRHGPLGVIEVDEQSGEIIRLTENEIRVFREKAAIYEAREQGILPVGEDGYVLAEYARRQGDRYLGDRFGMFFNAVEPLFVQREPPLWQVTIVFQMQTIGPFTLGTIDVDAQTGEPLALTEEQTQQIKERAHDIVDYRTQATAA